MTTLTSPTPHQAPSRPRPRSRSRAGAMALIAALAMTGALIAANLLVGRLHLRTDVTGAGDQTIAPRTRQMLARLDKPYRVVVATDYRASDRRARQRVADVLEEMHRFNDLLQYQFIDTSSGAGLTAYQGLVAELIDRDSRVLTDQSAAIELHVAGATSLASYLSDSLTPSLLAIQQALPPAADPARDPRTLLERAAGGARLMARDLSDASGRARDALKSKLGERPLPATDAAAKELARAYAPVVDLLGALARDLDRVAQANDGPAADQARQSIPGIRERRDQASVVLESLRRLRRPDVLRITDVLSKGSAALVIGPPDMGLAALDSDSLLPPGTLLDAADASRADLQRRAEELLATGLGSLLVPSRPIVVLTHAENVELLESTPLLSALGQRLRLRGVDITEWSVLAAEAPPKLASLNPDGSRPIVYISWPPDSTAAADRTGMTGAQRAARLAQVMTRLVDEGRHVALTLSQSVAPTYGDTDPFAPVLERFGLAADSARPLVREVASPRGRMVETDIPALPVPGSHPLAGALNGLPALLPWPITLHERPAPEHVRFNITPLLGVATADDLWAESQWLRLWQTPRDQRVYLSDLPVFDQGRDGRWPEGRDTGRTQRWIVAAAVERSELKKPVQRCLVVGSNGWFIDPITQQQVIGPDGRGTPRNPGNLELFEAGVAWLAGQDDLIAQSPAARAVSMIQDPGDASLARLRLAMVLGMPGLVLLLGALYRLIRR